MPFAEFANHRFSLHLSHDNEDHRRIMTQECFVPTNKTVLFSLDTDLSRHDTRVTLRAACNCQLFGENM